MPVAVGSSPIIAAYLGGTRLRALHLGGAGNLLPDYTPPTIDALIAGGAFAVQVSFSPGAAVAVVSQLGATFTVSASLTAGTASATMGASAPGQVLASALTLIPGSPAANGEFQGYSGGATFVASGLILPGGASGVRSPIANGGSFVQSPALSAGTAFGVTNGTGPGLTRTTPVSLIQFGANGGANAFGASFVRAPAFTPGVGEAIQTTLATLELTNRVFSTAAAPGTVIGGIQNLTPGSTLSLSPDNGKVVFDGGFQNLVVGNVASAVGFINYTITETLNEAVGSPKSTTVTVETYASATLQTLTVPNLTFPADAAPGSIIGSIANTAPGSTLSLSPNDNHVMLDVTPVGPDNLIVGNVASTVGTRNYDLVETLNGAVGSPKSTPIVVTVATPQPVVATGKTATASGLNNPYAIPGQTYTGNTAIVLGPTEAQAQFYVTQTSVLGTLTLTDVAPIAGLVWSASIGGYAYGSTIAATASDGTSLTVTDATVSGTFTTGGSKTVSLVETLGGATGSPKTTTISVTVAVPAALQTLGLSPLSIGQNAAYTGTITGKTAGSRVSARSADGVVLTVSGTTVTGSWATTGSKAVTLMEYLPGATGSPKSTDFTVNVGPSLVALTLSPTSVGKGLFYSGTITGKTSGSTIAATSSDGTTLTVSGSTVTGTFSAVGTPTITLTETLAGYTNSPRSNAVSFTVLPTLGALSLTPRTATPGSPYSGTISNVTSGSTVTASASDGTTLTVTGSGTTRSLAGTFPSTANVLVTLTETNAGAVGTPKATTINIAVGSAPSLEVQSFGGVIPVFYSPITSGSTLGKTN
jgi:hypothetical protein